MKFPVLGRITSRFGVRRHPVTKLESFHNGIDIAVPIGTDVICPLDGRVSNVYENEAGGKQLVIDHADGILTGYAHLSAYKVGRGAVVKKGQVIALTGNTGRTTGPHLHLTLTVHGRKVDPEDHFV